MRTVTQEGVWHKKEIFQRPPLTKYLSKHEYKKMVMLAKELGMLNMGDYILYCMRVILESHYPTKPQPFLEV